MNRILFFSGGLSSFAVAHYLKITYPNDNILLYFTDTKWEDEDLYRFINEASDKLELPMLTHSLGIDPVQLMIQQKIIFNSRMGNCSSVLKMKVSSDYIKKNKVPPTEHWRNKQYLKDENFKQDAILYFGISFDEFHRTKAIAHNWQPFKVEFPLTKMYFDYDDILALYSIDKPRMYLKGFTHNNCKGRCVKAGKKHFRLWFNEDRQTFDEINHIEQVLGEYVATWHLNKGDPEKEEGLKQNEIEMSKWHESNYTYKPKMMYVTDAQTKPSIIKNTYLEDIRKQQENNEQFDLFEEMGGCGCFVEYDQETEE